MKTQRNLAFLAILALATATSQADIYDFSYTFADGDKITGSLEGTPQAGGLVYVTDVLSMSFGGVTTPPGTDISPNYWDTQHNMWRAGGYVSSVASQVNIEAYYGPDNFEFVMNSGSASVSLPPYDSETINPARWLLGSGNSVSTPDGGLTIAMLGTAVSGLAFIRRKL